MQHLTDTARDRPYNKCTRTPKISQFEAGTTTLYTAHPFTTTHCAITKPSNPPNHGITQYTTPLIPTQDLFHPEPMTNTSGCYYVYNTPDDGRKLRPKHVEF